MTAINEYNFVSNSNLTVNNAILCNNKIIILHDNKISGEARLLQRLDYGTSGIVLATTQHTEQNEFLISQREGKCQKLYLALLSGLLHQSHLSGHPFKNNSVRRPGPSWIVKR